MTVSVLVSSLQLTCLDMFLDSTEIKWRTIRDLRPRDVVHLVSSIIKKQSRTINMN